MAFLDAMRATEGSVAQKVRFYLANMQDWNGQKMRPEATEVAMRPGLGGDRD